MPHRIFGTAGHIDHGKSSLVRALTGTDPDRLAEEKARGITIELGFADLDLGDGRIASLVDVPGHERFVRRMVAGAAGIDAVLLVVAADQGVQPQTREHLEICKLLDIRRGLVVISKTDLVDPELREVVELEIAEALEGSFLERAPHVAVSAETGAGLDTLKTELRELWDALPERPDVGVPRLPVDRSFTLKGFGTVVTGSLRGGRLAVGDEISVLPGDRRGRVRGLQVHGEPVEEARGGQRVAVNLQGLDTDDAARGSTLTEPGALEPTRRIWARVEFLAHAPEKLRRGGPVAFHHGTAETRARIRVRDPRIGTAGVELFLAEPLAVVPGDRFILRRPAPLDTVGGGSVLDASPPRRKPTGEDFAALESDDARDGWRYRIAREAQRGTTVDRLAGQTGLPADAVAEAVEALADDVMRSGDRIWAREVWDGCVQRVRTRLATFHEREPLRPGMPREGLRADSGGWPAESWKGFLESAAGDGGWRLDGEVVALASHSIELDEETAALESSLLARLDEAGLDPPSADRLLEAGPRDRVLALLDRARKDGRLLRLKDGRHVARAPVRRLLDALRKHAESSPTIDVAAFKDLAGVSRKNAIPLLEYFDERRWTRREGNVRRIRPDEFPED